MLRVIESATLAAVAVMCTHISICKRQIEWRSEAIRRNECVTSCLFDYWRCQCELVNMHLPASWFNVSPVLQLHSTSVHGFTPSTFLFIYSTYTHTHTLRLFEASCCEFHAWNRHLLWRLVGAITEVSCCIAHARMAALPFCCVAATATWISNATWYKHKQSQRGV